jgi:predicted NBD/HSP70 family sugar kinase
MHTMYVGIDIGGTNIRVASSESLDDPRITEKFSFANNPDYAQNEQSIIDSIRHLGSRVDGIGISTMGRLNESKTLVLSASAAPQWVNQPLVTRLKKTFGCRTVLDGDQYCAALSEAAARKPNEDFACIVYGTGLGCATVEYVSSKPIVRAIKYDDHIQFFRPWQIDCGGKWVSERYHKPLEYLSGAEWASVMDLFYGHLQKFVLALQPPRLVFGGGVAAKQWPRLEVVFNRLRHENISLRDFEISLVHYGQDAGLIGSLMLLQQ